MTVSCQPTGAGAIVDVRVRAGGRRTGVTGEHDSCLRVEVTAPPEKGKANRAVIKVLATVFSTSAASIELVSGATNSRKRFLIRGQDEDLIRKRLSEALGSEPEADAAAMD